MGNGSLWSNIVLRKRYFLTQIIKDFRPKAFSRHLKAHKFVQQGFFSITILLHLFFRWPIWVRIFKDLLFNAYVVILKHWCFVIAIQLLNEICGRNVWREWSRKGNLHVWQLKPWWQAGHAQVCSWQLPVCLLHNPPFRQGLDKHGSITVRRDQRNYQEPGLVGIKPLVENLFTTHWFPYWYLTMQCLTSSIYLVSCSEKPGIMFAYNHCILFFRLCAPTLRLPILQAQCYLES